LTFERSIDYALILEILSEPRCWRRMTGTQPVPFAVGPIEGIEYILAFDGERRASAVFLLVGGEEVHFCFTPEVWGHSEWIARGFLSWVWANTSASRLLGPVPVHNRLALRLAKRVGFQEYGFTGDLVLLEISRPSLDCPHR
jgi:hypothetical protein